mgnify:CR=1 FL=1
MSRIGKKPIELPPGVTATKNGRVLSVSGPKGMLSLNLMPEVDVAVEGNILSVKLIKKTKKSAAFWGLSRALISNMADGVSRGFEKKLEIEGIGYRAAMDGSNLQLSLGFSHPVEMKIPAGIKASVDKQTVITLDSNDPECLGQFAADVRKLRPPEPYKGKGIKYRKEVIVRKVGKSAGK